LLIENRVAIDYIFCMNKTTIVVFLILLAKPLFASELDKSISDLESAWAAAYYQTNETQQKQTYPVLLEKAAELVKRYPYAAEPKIWQATIMATNAAFESSLTALSTLETAKTLLEAAIKQDPNALEGSAYVTLGTLYYMVPGWPVSFGDNQVAEQLLKASLKINPNGIDANYFYADYLMQQDRVAEAEDYFRKAVQAPVRTQQVYADTQLQNEARLALVDTQQRKSNAGKSKFQSLFATATYIAK
jgi:tetratricopeptide (TPR) repeat protein